MTNPWVQTNQKIINTIKRTCLEHDLKGGYGGAIPLQHIIRLFDSAIIEINRLQKDNYLLTSEVKKYKPVKPINKSTDPKKSVNK